MTTRKLRLDTNEASNFIGCSPAALKISRSTGILLGRATPKYRKLGRTVLYDQVELNSWINQFPPIQNTAFHKLSIEGAPLSSNLDLHPHARGGQIMNSIPEVYVVVDKGKYIGIFSDEVSIEAAVAHSDSCEYRCFTTLKEAELFFGSPGLRTLVLQSGELIQPIPIGSSAQRRKAIASFARERNTVPIDATQSRRVRAGVPISTVNIQCESRAVDHSAMKGPQDEIAAHEIPRS